VSLSHHAPLTSTRSGPTSSGRTSTRVRAGLCEALDDAGVVYGTGDDALKPGTADGAAAPQTAEP
jgi:hypothetical protein